MNRLASLPRVSFAGHESFPFRHGWLKKGTDAIQNDPLALSRPEAVVELGVGKNMVYSIRHWLVALELAEHPEKVRDRKELRVTPLGQQIFGAGGWDPYLENVGTLWLLHAQLVRTPTRATTWWWSFHRPQTATFRRAHLVDEISAAAESSGWRTSPSSIKRDVDCFVRTYLPVARGRASPEDAYAAPLTALGLILPTLDREEYLLSYGWQPTLPDALFNWGLARHLDSLPVTRGSARTVSLSSLLFDDGSPGRVFRLNEEALVDRLARVTAATDGAWEYDETAGLQQLLVKRAIAPQGLLQGYYANQPALVPGRATA